MESQILEHLWDQRFLYVAREEFPLRQVSAKGIVGHGNFGAWIEAEFGMTDRTARNFIRAAERFGSKTEMISDLPLTVLYELAAPSTLDDVVEAVTENIRHEPPGTRA